MIKLPVMLMSSVPYGNAVPYRSAIQRAIQYRAFAPAKPPLPTSKRSNNGYSPWFYGQLPATPSAPLVSSRLIRDVQAVSSRPRAQSMEHGGRFPHRAPEKPA